MIEVRLGGWFWVALFALACGGSTSARDGAAGAAGTPGTGGALVQTGGSGGAGAAQATGGTIGTGGSPATGGTVGQAGAAQSGGSGGAPCAAGYQVEFPGCGADPLPLAGCYAPCPDGTCALGTCRDVSVQPDCAPLCNSCGETAALCIPDACEICTVPTLRWGDDGGMRAFVDASALEACSFTFTREYYVDPPTGPTSCASPLPPCGQTQLPDQSTIAQALADPDVAAALATAPVLYGSDPRPVDGFVLRIDVGGSIIEVGSACSSTGCTAIPAGVARLGDLLRQITSQQLGVPGCAGLFPNG
jgi:hypothetical protein